MTELSESDKELYNKWMDLRTETKARADLVRSGQMSNQDLFLELKEKYIIPLFTKIVYTEIPKKTSPEELQYKREYYQQKKRLEQIDSYQNLRKKKIDFFLEKRKSVMCYNCRKSVPLINPKAEWKISLDRHKEKVEKLIVSSVCPECNGKCSCFGGFISLKDLERGGLMD